MPQVIRLKSLRYILTSFAILLALITPLWADETEPDEVSRLLRRGEILPLATILANKESFAGKRVGIIITGGNVDLDALPWMTS